MVLNPPLWVLLAVPVLYGIGWMYWYLKHKMVSKSMYRAISFHKISDSPELGGTFNTKSQFESFMRFLSREGYKTVSIDDAIKNPEEKSILIFFDDAYENIYQSAYPIMKKYGFRGVLCPIAGYLGKDNMWDRGLRRFRHMGGRELREMSDDGFEVISHSMTHSDMRKMSAGELERETLESKRILSEITGKKTDYFIYPFGLCNDRVKRAVSDAGYRGAFASYNEDNTVLDRYAMGRNTMYIIDSEFDLKIILERKSLFLFGHEDQKGRIINWFSRFSSVIRV